MPVESGLYVLAGAVIGAAASTGTTVLQGWLGRRQAAAARQAAREEARADFQRAALSDMLSAVQAMLDLLVHISPARAGSLEDALGATWRLQSARAHVVDKEVRKAALHLLVVYRGAVAETMRSGAFDWSGIAEPAVQVDKAVHEALTPLL